MGVRGFVASLLGVCVVAPAIAGVDRPIWDNGEPDLITGQCSQTANGFNCRTADDFFVKDGTYFQINEVKLVMVGVGVLVGMNVRVGIGVFVGNRVLVGSGVRVGGRGVLLAVGV